MTFALSKVMLAYLFLCLGVAAQDSQSPLIGEWRGEIVAQGKKNVLF